METHGSGQGAAAGPAPTAAEAKAALQVAEQTGAEMAEIKTPLWFFLALGALVAPLGPIVAGLPDPPAGVVILVGVLLVWVAALVAIMSLVVRQMRVQAWLSEQQMRPFGAILLPLVAAYLVVGQVVDISWWSAGTTVVVGAGIAAFGIVHRYQRPVGAS